MTMPAIGPIGPMTDGIDEPFWEGLKAGELRIQRCTHCGTWTWAPQWRCVACGSWEMGWEAVAPEGRIFSWTRVWHAFAPAMKDYLPYVVGLVELPQAGGARLMGVVIGDTKDIRIGAPVTGVLQPASEGTSGYPVMRWTLAGH